MNAPTTIQLLAAVLFAIALLHTFSTKFFDRLADTHPRHAGLWHLLGEVEVVFGFWAMVLMLCMFALQGKAEATAYLDSRNFTEPLFVFAIMVVAGTRPILAASGAIVQGLVRLMPLPRGMARRTSSRAFDDDVIKLRTREAAISAVSRDKPPI